MTPEKIEAKAAPAPRWIQGWGQRDIDTLVAKVLLDHILWYGCESHLDVGANTTPYVVFSKTIGLRTARCDVRGYTHDCVLGALPRLPFKDKSYDLVSSIQVLEHLPRPYDAIKELCRVAGKLVIVQVPNGMKAVSHADPTHVNHFTFQELRDFRIDGWQQSVFASNVIASRLPYGVSGAHNLLSKIFTEFYSNNLFVVYSARGLSPKVRQPGLLTNM